MMMMMMMKKVSGKVMRVAKVTNIQYEPYDEDEYDVSDSSLFPKELDIPIPDHITCKYEIGDYISDEISNITGMCHEGFASDIGE